MLELKQQTIMRAIEALVNNAKWGDPKKYDIIIEKVKTGAKDWDVEYNVIPEPPTPLDVGIVELAKYIHVNLNALYKGEDPFAVTDEEKVSKDKMNGQLTASRNARPFVALYEASCIWGFAIRLGGKGANNRWKRNI